MKFSMFVVVVLMMLGVLHFAEESAGAPAPQMEGSNEGAAEDSEEGAALEERTAQRNSEEGEAMEERTAQRNSEEGGAMEERTAQRNSEEGGAMEERVAQRNSEEDAAREEDVGEAAEDGSPEEAGARSQQMAGNARGIITGPRIVVGAVRKIFKRPSDS